MDKEVKWIVLAPLPDVSMMTSVDVATLVVTWVYKTMMLLIYIVWTIPRVCSGAMVL